MTLIFGKGGVGSWPPVVWRVEMPRRGARIQYLHPTAAWAAVFPAPSNKRIKTYRLKLKVTNTYVVLPFQFYISTKIVLHFIIEMFPI